MIAAAELFLASASASHRKLQPQLFQLNLLARRRKLTVILPLPVLKLRQNPFHSAMLQTLSQASQLTYLLTPAPAHAPLVVLDVSRASPALDATAPAHKDDAEPDHLAQSPDTPSSIPPSVTQYALRNTPSPTPNLITLPAPHS